MKKIIYIITLGVSVLLISACMSDAPGPTPLVLEDNGGGEVVDTMLPYRQMCQSSSGAVDSICSLPYYILPFFNPDGYYGGGDFTTVLTPDGAETPSYANQNIRIVYTYNGSWGWGASFLHGSTNWTGKYKVKPGATKIKFEVRTDYSATVTFNAYADAPKGQKVLTKKPSPVTPVWEEVEILTPSVPAMFAAPLGITIAGYSGMAPVTVDLRNIRIE